MRRKEFIKTCGFACIGGSALTLMLEGCATSNYFAKTTATGNRLNIPKAEFIQVIKSGSNTYRKYVLVKNDRIPFPICIFRFNDKEYSALLMQCTHKGCELQPQGDYVACPCHGSEFNNKGVVQNPPAQENLKTYQITTDEENIYLQV